MMTKLLRWIARNFLSDTQRVHVAMNLLVESAMVWKPEELVIRMRVHDKKGDLGIIRVGPREWTGDAGIDASFDYEPHNNLNHCNAAGCPGCKNEGSEHMKGDF